MSRGYDVKSLKAIILKYYKPIIQFIFASGDVDFEK